MTIKFIMTIYLVRHIRPRKVRQWNNSLLYIFPDSRMDSVFDVAKSDSLLYPV